ncbi:MAG: DNA topoisomerase I [Planctomycetota bacterium]|nr:DNA topoisomerase I [Planctomycetota bacterium]MDA1213677.1 DNA topoisomerase I [Planctomycetota bacterium]
MPNLINTFAIRPVLRPLTRLIVGFIAIPLFRFFMKRVLRVNVIDAELEKDLEQWVRGSLILLVATRNMEELLFGWASFLQSDGEWYWILVGMRVMLAIGVIEMMPDQELFTIIHSGPPKLKFQRKERWFPQIRGYCFPFCRGLLCKHLSRSSPVFAILAAAAPGRLGWACFFLAITQYLIIGLVTSRDKAADVLSEFDRQVARRRRELQEEFAGNPQETDADPLPEFTDLEAAARLEAESR